jgi:hypothetical protein
MAGRGRYLKQRLAFGLSETRSISWNGTSSARARLLQCCDMADWRQIQARIRKAKNSSDPASKLAQLYSKTRDAMVAFEIGAIEEKAGRNDEAVRWYTTAAQRFRRAEWKTKAEEALRRLGAPLPATIAQAPAIAPDAEESHDDPGREPVAGGATLAQAAEEAAPSESPIESAAAAEAPRGKSPGRRRRGRRGGRAHRRGGTTPAEPVQPGKVVEATVRRGVLDALPVPRAPQRVEPEPPVLPSERTAHGRAGEPALASRLAHLEALLRRLVSSPLHGLEEAEAAPAGPGVYLLSDSDLITTYYVEACHTLRVGLGHLLRGGRSARSGGHSEGSLRARLAEHLGISEAKVSQYLKQHCVVRWIQLDDEATYLANFAIGVLRTPLNAE